MNQPIESLPLLVPARSVIGASSAIGAAHTTDRANSTALERKVALVGFAREDLKRKLFPPSLSFFFCSLPRRPYCRYYEFSATPTFCD